MDSMSDSEAYDQIEQMLAVLFGPEMAADAVGALRASGISAQDVMAMGGLPDLSRMSPHQMMALRAQVQQLMAAQASGEGVNWQLGEDIALQTARKSGDPVVTAALEEQTVQALRVADLWLDTVTDFMPAPGQREAWTRTQWVERTLPTWKQVCAPVAKAAVTVLADALRGQMSQFEEESGADSETVQSLSRQIGALGSIVSSLAGTAFAMQLGQAIGQLGGEAMSSTDAGLPLSRKPGTALVPSGVAAFAAGLEAGEDEVRMFLAVREAATARLYANVPWLAGQVLAALEGYAAEIHIDADAVSEAMSQIDPNNPDEIRAALESGMVAPKESPAQVQALEKLETLLALVEGWVEVVTARAVAPHLPHAVALQEMIRRRRLAGGAADQLFSRMVGMEFRPRRVREAARLWTLLGQEVGESERDAFWQHPDVMPSAAELASPEDFLTMRQAAQDLESDIDADLASLLDGTLGYADGVKDHDGDTQDGPQD